MTEALLDRLTDQDRDVRYAAVAALGGREFAETLMVLARKVRTLNQSSLQIRTFAAEPLMIRHYRRIDPADRPEVLTAMGWVATATQSDHSA